MKKGDKVVCTDNLIGIIDGKERKVNLTINNIYIIDDVFDGDKVRLKNDHGWMIWWYIRKFKLLSEVRKEKLNKLKVTTK